MNDSILLQTCEPATSNLQSKASPPQRILVAEDDPFICQLNTKTLLHAGYEVDTAADGAAAWQALNANRYDLLITDNSMPKVSGVELLKQLRAVRMELPSIMATGTLPQHEFDLHPWLQPTATLLKPYTIEQLLRTVAAVLREANRANDRLPQLKNLAAPDQSNPLLGELVEVARPRTPECKIARGRSARSPRPLCGPSKNRESRSGLTPILTTLR